MWVLYGSTTWDEKPPKGTQMYYVGSATREATTKCPGTFNCLTNGPKENCKVLAHVDGDVLLLQCCREEFCVYQTVKEYRKACTCPTRIKLYERYGI